jgi:hypothetical protein
VNATPKRPHQSAPKFDLYGLPDDRWTGKKRRSLFRRRRVEHLAALESPPDTTTPGTFPLAISLSPE